jgi:hypothetical protein
MTPIKTVVLSVTVWGALATIAHAAPMSWYGGQSTSPLWYAYQAQSDASFYVPSGSVASFYLTGNANAWWNSIASAAGPSTTASAPVVSTAASISPPASGRSGTSASPVDAYINFGPGPFAESSNLTTGNLQAWYNSPSAISAFGGVPNVQQQSSLTQSVLNDIQHTFQISGLNISLTSDPNTPALHTMSVVSGGSYGPSPSTIGITDVGANGFSFIDKLAYATTPDQLAWAVAHNLSHELMHALGVGNHPDATGNYLDAATASWQMLTDPNTRFSPAAVQLISQLLASGSGSPISGAATGTQLLHGLGIDGAQALEAPVPEPSTIAIWTVVAVGGMVATRRQSRRRAA